MVVVNQEKKAEAARKIVKGFPRQHQLLSQPLRAFLLTVYGRELKIPGVIVVLNAGREHERAIFIVIAWSRCVEGRPVQLHRIQPLIVPVHRQQRR